MTDVRSGLACAPLPVLTAAPAPPLGRPSKIKQKTKTTKKMGKKTQNHKSNETNETYTVPCVSCASHISWARLPLPLSCLYSRLVLYQKLVSVKNDSTLKQAALKWGGGCYAYYRLWSPQLAETQKKSSPTNFPSRPCVEALSIMSLIYVYTCIHSVQVCASLGAKLSLFLCYYSHSWCNTSLTMNT